MDVGAIDGTCEQQYTFFFFDQQEEYLWESQRFFFLHKKVVKKRAIQGEKLLMLIAHLEFLDPSLFNVQIPNF